MRVAVTGGIAEGKSTVVSYAASLGVETASADLFAAEVFADPSVQERLAHALGLPLPLDRAAVRTRLADPEMRRRLNAVTHPGILKRMAECPAPIVEVPLLLEGCLQGLFGRVWVVTCGPEEQLRRLTQRMGNHASALELVRTQLPIAVKCAFADHVFRTDMPEETVFHDVRAELRRCGLV